MVEMILSDKTVWLAYQEAIPEREVYARIAHSTPDCLNRSVLICLIRLG